MARQSLQEVRRSGGFNLSVLLNFFSPVRSHFLHRVGAAGIENSATDRHRHPGPGLLESIYRECLAMELAAHQVRFESERHVPIDYKEQRVRGTLKLNLLVEGCVVVELKVVEAIHSIHLAQVMTYLKLTGYPAGLLLNFYVTSLRSGLRRLDHPDRYVRKQEGRS